MISPKTLLFLSLFLTFAFSVIGWAVVINALVKSSDESSYIKSLGSSFGFSTVDIDYKDITAVCAVIAASCALLTVLSVLSAFLQLLPFGKKRLFVFLQANLLLFGALWVLATVIACDVLYATRSTKITATISGTTVPQSTIQTIEQVIGVSPAYNTKSYLKLCAILPWFASLFAALSALLLYRVARNSREHVAMDETDTEKITRSSDVKHEHEHEQEQE